MTSVQKERYRKDGDHYCIDLKVHDIRQLYDNRDPSPFRERDLDEDLARYLVVSAEEIPASGPFKIVLSYVPGSINVQQREDFDLAISDYFSHEVRVIDNELRFLLKRGQYNFLFAIIFLFICVFLANNVIGDHSLFRKGISEGLNVMGWVACWRPINIFLYEWWPYVKKRKSYLKLAEAEVEFK